MKKFFHQFGPFIITFCVTYTIGMFVLNVLNFNIHNYFNRPSSAYNADDNGSPTVISDLKKRLNSCFYDEADDDFFVLINYEDEEFGEDALFSVYYRQKNGATNNFLIVPDSKAKLSWIRFLTKVRNNNTSHLLGELEQFSFSLQGETIWVTTSAREA